MPLPVKAAKPLPANLIKTRVEGTTLVSPLKTAAELLTVETEADLAAADGLLARVQTARKEWGAKMEKIIKPLRDAKSAADELKREVDQPLAVAELTIKNLIRDYRVAEADRLEAAREEQAEAQRKLTQELEETAAREQTARTKQMRDRLAAKREALEERVEEVAAEAPEAAVTAHSQTRHVKKWRLSSNEMAMFNLLKGILSGQTPIAVIQLDTAFIGKQPLDTVAQWPGFEVYDDIVIAARRG